MKQLLEWIKANIKEDANIAEAEEMITKLNPLESLKTDAEHLDFIQKNRGLKSALDAETSRRVDNAIGKYEKEKLPGIVKDEIQKLKDDESEDPKDKRIRELEEKDRKREAEEKFRQRRDKFRKKAEEIAEEKGLKYDATRADYYLNDEDPEAAILKDIVYLKTTIDESVSSKIKDNYILKDPESGSGDPAKTIKREDFEKLSPQEKVDFAKDLTNKVVD